MTGSTVIELPGVDFKWYALRVRSNSEPLAAEYLSRKGFETCLPLWRRKPGGANKKKASSALFPGYLFCRFDSRELLPIVTVPWVIDVVSRGRTPEAVTEEEIRGIQALAASGLAPQPHAYLSSGALVQVVGGPLDGVEGIFLREKGQDRLVLSVSLLLRSVSVEIERWNVVPVRGKKPGDMRVMTAGAA